MKNIKWLFSVCLMVVFVCFSNSGVSAEEAEIYASVFKYDENEDGTITITGYTGTDETVVIPSEIDGKSVISIGNFAFRACKNLEIVLLPSTLEKIGNYTFKDSFNLKTISLLEGLTSIGEGAFERCYNLKNIILPNSLTNLGTGAFNDCHSLSKVSIPANVHIIKLSTFRNCINLQEVEIKEGVTKIEQVPFFGCSKLKKIIIPDSVKIININTFVLSGYSFIDLTIYANPNSYARKYANQKGIKFSCLNFHDWDNGTITIEPTIKRKGEQIFSCTACGIKKIENLPMASIPKKGKSISAFNSHDIYKVTKSGKKNGTVEFTKTNNALAVSMSIPNTITISGITYKVTSIAKSAFKNNKKLKEVIIGKNVTKINTNAFLGCKNLKTISIKSKNIKTVGKNLFKGIHPKAKIKVPSKNLKKYKILLKNKGQKPSVKIIK